KHLGSRDEVERGINTLDIGMGQTGNDHLVWGGRIDFLEGSLGRGVGVRAALKERPSQLKLLFSTKLVEVVPSTVVHCLASSPSDPFLREATALPSLDPAVGFWKVATFAFERQDGNNRGRERFRDGGGEAGRLMGPLARSLGFELVPSRPSNP